jgi:hypothetical protein
MFAANFNGGGNIHKLQLSDVYNIPTMQGKELIGIFQRLRVAFLLFCTTAAVYSQHYFFTLP